MIPFFCSTTIQEYVRTIKLVQKESIINTINIFCTLGLPVAIRYATGYPIINVIMTAPIPIRIVNPKDFK